MFLKKTEEVKLSREEENELIFERERQEMLLDICNAAARWEKTGDEVFSGSSFSVALGEETVSGKLFFNQYGMDVEMTSPAQMTMHWHSFHPRYGALTRNGKKDGPATDECRRTAVGILMGIYNDWKEILGRKETILAKYRVMPEKEREYMERETARSAVLREKEKMLAHLSGELKRCFKAGLFSQKEYVPIRRSLHDRIVAFKLEGEIPDFFSEYFKEELEVCRTVKNPKELIEKVFAENNDR